MQGAELSAVTHRCTAAGYGDRLQGGAPARQAAVSESVVVKRRVRPDAQQTYVPPHLPKKGAASCAGHAGRGLRGASRPLQLRAGWPRPMLPVISP